MRPEMIPVEIKEIIDRAAGKEHSATGSVMTALAEVLTVYEKTWTETAEWLQAQLRQGRKISEIQTRLIVAHERLVAASGLEEWLEDHDSGVEETGEVRRWRRELDAATCPCCVFGNHTERCACDGENCCHPENHSVEEGTGMPDPEGAGKPEPKSDREKEMDEASKRIAAGSGNPEGIPGGRG